MALKDLEIKYAARRAREYKLFDGDGLYLLVKPAGSKLWRFKYRFGGKERVLCIGPYPAISVIVARQKRREAQHLLDGGIDPAAVKKRNKASKEAAHVPQSLNLFEPIARAWHANRVCELDPAHAARVMSRMERDVFPSLGQRDITTITAPEILAVVRKVEARGALDISRRMKQGIGQVFRFAIASGWATHDPTSGINDALKPKPRVRHMPKVPLAELPELVAAIQAYDGEADARSRETTRDAMFFTLLTRARTSEPRFAQWEEFGGLDGDEPLWRLPPERMKMEREHLVPLSSQVRELLRRRRALSDGSYIFAGAKPGHPISENTMIFACYRMGYRGRQTGHGFRGLASTWANEAERFKSDWIEWAHAHADEKEVRGAYNSALYLTPRRRMLQHWADEIFQLPPAQSCSRSRASTRLSPPSTAAEVKAPLRQLPADRAPFWQRSGRRHDLARLRNS